MKQQATFFSTLQELDAFLADASLRDSLERARSVLAQVFISRSDDAWARAVAERLSAADERIVVVGATTAGEICAGQARSATNVVVLLLFETSVVQVLGGNCPEGQEDVSARRILDGLSGQAEPLQGVLLLATMLTVDIARLLQALHDRAPGLPLFGGGAADGLHLGRVAILQGVAVREQGYVAVGLYGADLAVMRQSYLGWKPMGKRMRAGVPSRFRLATIDGRPALDAYRHYLGIEDDERLFLNAMEFPLLVQRGAHTVARIPARTAPDGGVEFAADIEDGESLQFGYAHVDGLVDRARRTRDAVRDFGPQAILFYACCIRYFVMQRDVDLELQPYEALAPTAGFFTYGEFCDLGDGSPLMNSALVVVALREGPQRPPAAAPAPAAGGEGIDLYAHGHLRILSRFQHFTRAIAADLEQANRELQVLAQHDGLTGLGNRRKFQAQIAGEMARSQRHGQPFSVMLCDIDHFKQLNDDLGHDIGDVALRQVAHVLARQARSSDTACRWGGEEFVVLLPQTPLEEALRCAERLRQAVQDLVHEATRPLPRRITISIGVAAFGLHGSDEAALLNAADRALYQAKRQGRNQVCAAAFNPPR